MPSFKNWNEAYDMLGWYVQLKISNACVFTLTRTEKQMGELKALSHEWALDPYGFWSFDEVVASLQRPSYLGYYIADDVDGRWKALVLAQVGPFTADLLYIYVRPEFRGQGHAYKLLLTLETGLTIYPHLEALFLEVRVSHSKAIVLYETFGMARIGIRKRYYRDGEDAFVYEKKLTGKDHGQS